MNDFYMVSVDEFRDKIYKIVYDKIPSNELPKKNTIDKYTPSINEILQIVEPIPVNKQVNKPVNILQNNKLYTSIITANNGRKIKLHATIRKIGGKKRNTTRRSY